MQASAEREEGPWFPAHRGYEVQISDGGDSFHRTGAIYSLAPSSAVSKKAPGEWKTMLITLVGDPPKIHCRECIVISETPH